MLANFGLAAAVAPPCYKAYSANPESGHVPYTSFPTWLGKNSSQKKTKRLVSELRTQLSRRIQCSEFDTVQLLVPLLNKIIMEVFEEPERVMEILEYYNISMDMFKEHLMELEFDGFTKQKFDKVTAAVKTKMTRLYNKTHQ